MFRSEDQRRCPPSPSRRLAGLIICVAALLVGHGLGLAQDGPADPSSPKAPQSGTAVPEAGQRPDGAQGGRPEVPDGGGRDGAAEPEAPSGCPYRDRPLNLLV